MAWSEVFGKLVEERWKDEIKYAFPKICRGNACWSPAFISCSSVKLAGAAY
jgi:hypothetical protein